MATVGTGAVPRLLLEHLLETLAGNLAENEPFSHFYLKNVFPDDIYARMMEQLPDSKYYTPLSTENYHMPPARARRCFCARWRTYRGVAGVAVAELWDAIGETMKSPELKKLVFEKLAVDLAARFHVPREETSRIFGIPKASLFRDTDGYEIAPHPDGRAKVVTMQLYLPADRSQLRWAGALCAAAAFAEGNLFVAGTLPESEAIRIPAKQRLCVCRLELVAQEKLARTRIAARRFRRAEHAVEYLLRPRRPKLLRLEATGYRLQARERDEDTRLSPQASSLKPQASRPPRRYQSPLTCSRNSLNRT